MLQRPVKLVIDKVPPDGATEVPSEPTDADADVPLGLDEIFLRFGPALIGRAARILGQREGADDLVQDVFLDAQRSLGRIRSARALYAWLSVATVRLARHRLRVQKVRRFFRLDDAVDYRQLIDRRASPDECALLAEVYQVLERLPIEQRLAWTERHLEGEALDQVARLCGCSLATAKRRIAAAQAALDKEIGRE